jgi:hypothetical protein
MKVQYMSYHFWYIGHYIHNRETYILSTSVKGKWVCWGQPEVNIPSTSVNEQTSDRKPLRENEYAGVVIHVPTRTSVNEAQDDNPYLNYIHEVCHI